MSYIINIPIALTAKDIDNIMVTATEGGINDWCRGMKVVKKPDHKIEGYNTTDEEYNAYLEKNWDIPMKDCSEVILGGGHILLIECENDHKENPELYTLTLEKLLKGVELALTKSATDPHHRTISLENYDAIDADLFVQYGLFGELVYS